MTKEQVLNNFWNGFGVSAYDENTVPDDATLPRITYEMRTDNFGHPVLLVGSIWDRSKSWASVTGIKDQIAEALARGGMNLPYEGGTMWVKRSTPFAQRMGDTDDSIRRILINIEVEFTSEV